MAGPGGAGAQLLNVSDKLTANFHWNLPIVQIIIGRCSVLGVMGAGKVLEWNYVHLTIYYRRTETKDYITEHNLDFWLIFIFIF